LIAGLSLLAYFPALLVAYAYFGNISLVLGLIPCIFWGIWLGPEQGSAFAFLLINPHYLMFLLVGATLDTDAIIELLIAHIVFATVTYFIANGFHLRKHLAEQLRASEQAKARFRGLFDRTSDMVFIIGLDLNIIDANDEALQLLGYRRDELIGAPYRQLIAPEDVADLDQRVQAAAGSRHRPPMYERSFLRKDGERIVAEMDAGLVFDGHQQPIHYQAIGRDIRTRKAAEMELYRKATLDELTGLYNRAMFSDILTRAIERSKRSNTKIAVLFIDLDGFKKVNDTYGHTLGDGVLQHVADNLQRMVRSSDAVARLGGDEFAVILEDLSTRKEAQQVAVNIEAALSQPFTLPGANIHIGASIGVGLYPDDGTNPQALVHLADMRMYTNKRQKYALANDA